MAYSRIEVPADDPGQQFAERGVGVGVGAAGDRRHRGELGVAEGGQNAADAGDDVGQHDRGPGSFGGDAAGHHEDAGADDRPDAQRRQRQGPSTRWRRFSPSISACRVSSDLRARS